MTILLYDRKPNMASGSFAAAGSLAVLTKGGTGAYVVPELPRVTVNTAYTAPTGTIHSVASGGDLQAALNAAQPGDIVELAAGATFTGNFDLPAKSGASYIHVRSSAYASLPALGTRVAPSDASNMAKIVTTNATAALRAANDSHHWRLIGLEIVWNPSSYTYRALGIHPESPSSLANYPHHIIVDRCYFHPGDDTKMTTRAVLANGAHVAVVDSYIEGCHWAGNEAQGIEVFDSPGPIHVENCYIEGAAQCFMVGGAATQVADLVTEDVTFRRNWCRHPLSWMGSAWMVKNLWETKNVRRILAEGNVFENSWAGAGGQNQAIVIKSNGEGPCHQAVAEDVTFRYNIIKNTTGAYMISGTQENYVDPGTYTPPINQRIALLHNLWLDIGNDALYNVGDDNFKLQQVYQGGTDITVAHNTFIPIRTYMMLEFSADAGNQGTRFRYLNNIADLGYNGVYGGGAYGYSFGSSALTAYYPGYAFAGNVISWNANQDGKTYPAGNYWPANYAAIGLTAEHKLPPGSPYLGGATDGTNPGADIDTINALTAGVAA